MRIRYFESGYVSHAVAARGHREALKAAGATMVDRVAAADVVILHDEPPTYRRYFDEHPALKTKYVVGYAVWETDRLPEAYREGLGLVAEVWTASRYSQAALQSAHPRVHLVPHVVRRVSPSPAARSAMRARLGDGAPRFLCIADARNPRKNLPALLSAFAAVRGEHPAATLVVKQYARTDAALGSQPGVVSIEGALHGDEIAALHQLCDAYVSPHRAEAWGLGLSEAMAQGRLVIATGHGGPMDYLDDDVAVILPFTLRPLTADEVAFAPGLFAPDMQWAEVDPTALAAAMKGVVGVATEGAEPDPRAERGRARILERFGPEAAARIAATRLEDLKTRVTPRRGKPSRPDGTPRIGMWHAPAETYDVIVGRQVVVDEFAHALDAHGHHHRYGLFCPADRAPGLADALGAPTERLDVLRREDALSSALAITAWHDAQFDPTLAMALRARRGDRYPITTTHHSLSYTSLLREQLMPLLLSRPLPWDAIVCTTAPARRVVARLLAHVAGVLKEAHGLDVGYRGQLITIPLGVDTQRFRPRDRGDCRYQLGLPADAEILLWVGRLSAVDKADLLPLVTAVAELKKRHPKLRLVCAGRQRAGERFGDVIAGYARSLGIGESVEVRTDVGDELPVLYGAADLFVAPVDNPQESFGLSPVEAMASGIPQVVADWDGYRDTVVDGQTGALIPTLWTDAQADIEAGSLLSDPAFDHLALSQSVAVNMVAFVAAVDELLDRPERRAQMAEASRLRAEMLFGWPSVIAAHELMWNDLAETAAAHDDHDASVDLSGLHQYPYAFAFRHYPTTWLAPDAPLTITERGLGVMQRGEGLPLPMLPRFAYLEPQLLQRILVGLAKMAQKQAPLSLERIFAVVAKDHPDTPASRARIHRHVMWLIKYGYAQRTSD